MTTINKCLLNARGYILTDRCTGGEYVCKNYHQRLGSTQFTYLKQESQ